MDEKNDLFGAKHATLWQISMWANGLAPLVLFVYILLSFWQIFEYKEIAHTQHNTDLLALFSHNYTYIIDVILQMGRIFLLGVIYYVLLKGVSHALDIVVETDINYREKLAESPYPENVIAQKKEVINEDDGLEEWEEKLLDDKNQPQLYDTLEVLQLRDNVKTLSVAVIVVWILLGLLNFQFIRMLLLGVLIPFSAVIGSIQPMIFTTLAVGIQIAIIYFPLRALIQILRILMEMEFNSRKAKS